MTSYRKEYQEEMKHIHNEIIRMGYLVEEAFQKSVTALFEDDLTLAAEVKSGDDAIDKLERSITQACISIIARQKPVASDLRDIAANMKLVTDLERIADHAEDISDSVFKMHDKRGNLVIPQDLYVMSDLVKSMINGALDAYVSRDHDLSYKIIRLDDKSDMLAEKLISDISKQMQYYPEEELSVLINLIMITSHLERAADHAQNVAEWIVYYIDGKYAYELGDETYGASGN
ncbi:MAG: phosphate signaling complex protein PhoU [Eubacteriales bacterium]|nr:phosphate signaling complex protein PhoU [Eubacteriales bacterium]MDD4323647.1 phosphate signaling complex protein PhoU [Eubacteriales bacterium]MDD4540845.1 phosphate signaling complex protein PhoU [Eubacteriales bacterium]